MCMTSEERETPKKSKTENGMKLNKKHSGGKSVKFPNSNQYYTERWSSKGSEANMLLHGPFETEQNKSSRASSRAIITMIKKTLGS